MKAANGIGFHVEAHDNILGWRRATRIVATRGEAQALLDKMPADAVQRRVYESLEGLV